jgi:serine/threonine-protein phosphatase 2A regulatory subunit B
VDEGYESMEKK